MASDPTTWAELKTALANWLSRDDLNTTEIPEAIALTERRCQRTVFAPERETEASLVTVAATETVALPTDLWGVRAVYISADPKVVLEPMTLADLRNTYPTTFTARPQNYAIRGENLVLGPTPDGVYSIKLTYIQTIPALSGSVATNWLLTDHPDVYIYGALSSLLLLIANRDPGELGRAQFYDARFREAAEEVNRTAVRRTQGSAPIRIRSSVVV